MKPPLYARPGSLGATAVAAGSTLAAADDTVNDAAVNGHQRHIGDILRGFRPLTDEQIEHVLDYQRQRNIKFGAAVVALQLASESDVMRALSQQFRYPCTVAPDSQDRRLHELVAARNPFGAQAEAMRDLRTQLLLGVLAPDQPRRAVAVVSPNRRDGKSFVAANLAIAFSQLGGHTLLIDVDMRTPRQHDIFGMNGRSGLSNILSGRAEADIIRPLADLPSLYVLPVGAVPPNPLELVQRSAFGMLVHELLGKFDHVIVDTPAVSQGSDASVIASRCGAALVIGRRGKSRLQAMDKLVSLMSRGQTAVAGVVMNER